MRKISSMRVKRFYAQMSLDQLSFLTRIEKSRLSRIENGWVVPSDRELRRIARALKVEVSEIFGEAKDGRS